MSAEIPQPAPRRRAKPFVMPEFIPLYPDEKTLAQLVLGPDRAHMWPAIAMAEERAGLPRVQLAYGGRYWPAVLEFYGRRFSSQLLGPPVAGARSRVDDFEGWEERRRARIAKRGQRTGPRKPPSRET